MLLFLLSIALSNTQQAKHDLTEWKIAGRIQVDGDAIADIWHPPFKLLADYGKAKKCYVKFHLYRTDDCSAELNQVERDLGAFQMARIEDQ